MNQALEKGTVLRGAANSYTIERTLGQGSFGITYLATAQLEGPLGKVEVEVAVKEFFMKEINTREGSSVTGGSSQDGLFDKYRQKFRRESENLSRMQHKGIVNVIESFDVNNTSYIAMQYLGGGSLDDLIKRQGRISEKVALRYAHSIGEALSYMHAHHMLHLDLKPSNVMINRQGDPVIIDFGLSKQYDDEGNPESSTTVGGGTPGYAPLEQASYREGKDFPVTMDVYALGATLFKMLTGHRPPEADQIMNDGFPYADLKDVSQATIDAVAKAMAFRKADRFQSVTDFLAAVGDASAASEATSFVTDEATKKLTVQNARQEVPPLNNRYQSKADLKKESSKTHTKKYLIICFVSLILVAIIVGGIVLLNSKEETIQFFEDTTQYDEDTIQKINNVHFYLKDNGEDFSFWDAKLHAVVDGVDHLVELNSSSDVPLCIALEDTIDVDGDGDMEAIIRNIQACGGNGIGDCFFIVKYMGNGYFSVSDNMGSDAGDVEIEPWNGRTSFVILNSLSNHRNEKLRYVYENGQVKLVESMMLGYQSIDKEIKSSDFHNGKEEESLYLRSDLDCDGKIDTIICTYWDRWDLMFVEVHFYNGYVDRFNVGSSRIGLLSTKTNGVFDILADENTIIRWNGNRYVDPRASDN